MTSLTMTFLDTRRTVKSYEERLQAKPENTRISNHTSLNNFEKYCQLNLADQKKM